MEKTKGASGRSFPERCVRAVIDGLAIGPPAAAVNFFADARAPVNPQDVWRFFTRPLPRLIDQFIDAYPPPARRSRVIARMMTPTHAAGIEYHYDVSNDFYRLFLDTKFMFYSCADFEAPEDTLEQAQTRKADHLLGLLDPQPGETILELGCGWGSMLRHICAHTGEKDKLFGYTLSREQARYIAEHFGYNVFLEDFTAAELGREVYDKIYSIGAMEHILPEEVLPLLRKLHTALKPGGRLVQHFFDLNGTDPLPTSMISAQQFFPGSVLSLHSDHLRWAKEAGFRLAHDSEHDYRPTLRAWFDNLVRNRDEAHRIVGVPTTNKYLAFFASSWAFFNRGKSTLHRLTLMKD